MLRPSLPGITRRPLMAALLVIPLSGTLAACASNEPQSGYRFEVLDQPVPVGTHSTIPVRLTNASNGQPVVGATMSDVQMTMRMARVGPPGKGVWQPRRLLSKEIRFVGSPGAGLYNFLGDVSMSGTWRLSLTALVPGESSPVEGLARFTASQERHDP
jgi:hypothetical protein